MVNHHIFWMHEGGGCIETNLYAIQVKPVKRGDLARSSRLGVVVCKQTNFNLLLVNCIEKCWEYWEGLLLLFLQSAPNAFTITLLFVMGAVTPAVETYNARGNQKKGLWDTYSLGLDFATALCMNWLLSNRKTKEGLIHVECMGENARLTLRLCPPKTHHKMRYRYVHTYTMETLRSAWPSY